VHFFKLLSDARFDSSNPRSGLETSRSSGRRRGFRRHAQFLQVVGPFGRRPRTTYV